MQQPLGRGRSREMLVSLKVPEHGFTVTSLNARACDWSHTKQTYRLNEQHWQIGLSLTPLMKKQLGRVAHKCSHLMPLRQGVLDQFVSRSARRAERE